MKTILLNLFMMFGLISPALAGNPEISMQPLNPAEARVIREKGTEAPFSGEYWNHKAEGVYVCRQCGLPLYISKDKFDSRCGWPSFDDAVPGSVIRHPDADGMRTEILCASCGGHLGHVFEGEGFTEKNTRHCVNSISLKFIGGPAGVALLPASGKAPENAYFAGGCFWGTEDAFAQVVGVLDVVSGYSGGHVPNPDYKQVSNGSTGHAETVRITFDPGVISFEELAKLFFEIHDPTQMNRQGPDMGSQYRSAVFYTTPQQKEVTERLVQHLRTENKLDVVTEIQPFSVFYPAEDYHQNYTARTGRGACHFKVKRFE